MRMIGEISSDKHAATFRDYLYVKGIENEVERESNGVYSLWVHDEEQISLAKDLLARFLANPMAAEFKNVADAARRKMKAQAEEDEAARTRVIDGRQALAESAAGYNPYFSVLLLVASIGVFSVCNLDDKNLPARDLLLISATGRDLPEVMSGEIWRLITPIFLHGGWPHILLNMLALKDLGPMIEGKFGTRYFCLLVLVTAVCSNVAQDFTSGPLFGGMSGVIYGLLGFCWVRGKYDPKSEMELPAESVVMMLAWFFLCMFHLVSGIANTAHGVGLLVGMVWGFTSAMAANRRA